MDRSASIPRPYSKWFNPEKSWTDIIFSWILSWLLPYNTVTQCPATKEALPKCQEIRVKFEESMQKQRKTWLNEWELVAKCPIVEQVHQIPRRTNLLQEWGLTSQSFDHIMPKEDIPVHVLLPASLSKDTTAKGQGVKTNNVEASKNPVLPQNVPIVVWFHGGSLAIGEPLDHSIQLAARLTKKLDKPLILATVSYSLVPDCVFPVQPIEAMTVLDHFLREYPNNEIHVAGVSAGGYLALVAGMECFRRHASRIQSIVSLCPMLNPACDTLSCYMNSESSYVPLNWSRWCWRAYLELPESQDTTLPEPSLTLDDVCALNSNRTTWNECPWKGSSLERLIQPVFSLPEGLDSASAPSIVFLSNRADQLYSDAQVAIGLLQSKSTKLTCLNHPGSHWIGTYLDSRAYEELVNGWASLMDKES